MLGALKKIFLAVAKDAAVERTCPKCSHHFKPLADREVTSWSDFTQACTCPACGASLTAQELMRTREQDDANPEGPFRRPLESRIERQSSAGDRLTFYIPSAGCWDLSVIIPIVVNLFAWPLLLGAVSSIGTRNFSPFALLFASLLAIVAVRITYWALRRRYGSTLLELSPETVRLQRSLWNIQKNRELATADVQKVSKVQFYTRDYKPVYGIEIAAGCRRIRFGSSLTDDEKNWLCWEIREYLRLHSARATVSPAVEALVRRP